MEARAGQGGPLLLTRIVGDAGDPGLAARLRDLAHAGLVETIRLAPRDAGRSRQRARTDRGADCAIAIPRGERLRDGAVLLLDERRAIVVRLGPEVWLALRPRDAAAALRLGYQAGNLHWRVRFGGADLQVAADGGADAALARIRDLIEAGAVTVVDD